MITLSLATQIHHRVAALSGGDVGIRDEGLLLGALAAPYQTFGGCELYPTPLDKAVRLGSSVIRNHPFVDGNKRTGVVLMLTLLRALGVKPALTNADVVKIGLGVASGEMSDAELHAFLASKIDRS